MSKEQDFKLMLTVVCVVALAGFTSLFMSYFVDKADTMSPNALASAEGYDDSDASRRIFTSDPRVADARKTALAAEAEFQSKLRQRRQTPKKETDHCEDYVEDQKTQLEETIRAIGREKALASDSREQLKNLKSGDH
ncbi:MAG: hypothetical protein AAF483_20565 [Planctomycetota bacterium]